MRATTRAACLEHLTSPILIEITPHAFVLTSPQNRMVKYGIPKSKVVTPQNILGWVDHLGHKNWVTTEHLRAFVSVASQHLGLRIHR